MQDLDGLVKRLEKWGKVERTKYGPTNNALVMCDAASAITSLKEKEAALGEALLERGAAVASLQEELGRVKSALSFYGSETCWTTDGGVRAREALSSTPQPSEGKYRLTDEFRFEDMSKALDYPVTAEDVENLRKRAKTPQPVSDFDTHGAAVTEFDRLVSDTGRNPAPVTETVTPPKEAGSVDAARLREEQ